MRNITIRPAINEIWGTVSKVSYWVEEDGEWIGNMHKRRDGKVDACAKDGMGCEICDNPYDALNYIKEETK